MSDADSGNNDPPNMTTITLKIPEAFLDDLDATWRAENFPSRSEFIRWALRDAVRNPAFSRESWKDIATSEHQRRTGEGEIHNSDAVKRQLNEDTDDDT